ncbi:MAG: CHAP domain-containing protein [Sulfurimonas sp.]|uniref:NlpC/P60 family protein n=1 Tax=Sulfurimonas sp. TaxID=2022749 RepID=UPI0026215E50|nr:CHAP domain-containing protein [Sulfurimonas sp.]MDD5373838.1 CHAP domain-containing protein [Sulfurimonas sp.]
MKKIIFSFALMLAIFTGCAQKQVIVIDEPKAEEKKEETEPKIDGDIAARKAVVSSALKYLNKKDGQDCSGLVELINHENSQIYYKSEKLYKYFDNTNRSKAIFNMMKTENKLVTTNPKMGDLIFFEDTLQKTKRKTGSFNITHVGIVTQIDSDGTVHFIHNIQGKNRIDQINMNFADSQTVSGKNVNSYIKRCPKEKQKSECLSSYFFSAYAAPSPTEYITLSKN